MVPCCTFCEAHNHKTRNRTSPPSSTRMSSSGMERPPLAVVPGPGAIDPADQQAHASARLGLSRQLYNTHQKVSHYVLRHTSRRLRSVVEHAALGLAMCGFCVVILSHRTFVHREDIASISREGGMAESSSGENNNGYLGLIGEGRGVSMYHVLDSGAINTKWLAISSIKFHERNIVVLVDGEENSRLLSEKDTWLSRGCRREPYSVAAR